MYARHHQRWRRFGAFGCAQAADGAEHGEDDDGEAGSGEDDSSIGHGAGGPDERWAVEHRRCHRESEEGARVSAQPTTRAKVDAGTENGGGARPPQRDEGLEKGGGAQPLEKQPKVEKPKCGHQGDAGKASRVPSSERQQPKRSSGQLEHRRYGSRDRPHVQTRFLMHNQAMPPAFQFSAARRPKWFLITVGVTLIVVAVALTVGFQILGATDPVERAREAGTLRWVIYFLGTLLSMLLIGGLGLLFTLLLREVRLNERQSNFVSAVTHELKTPVSSLRLYLDTLEMRDVSPEQRARFYGTMREDLERLTVTINNVLNAAMYADRARLDPRPLDFARLVRRSMDLTRTRHQLPAAAFRYDGPTGLELQGEAQALETAVLNLLDNAVKYSREKVEVDVVLRSDEEGRAHLSVRDQGVGMSRAHLRFVFNRFYRIGSEARRSHTGTGLGLFIVRSVARNHKGRVVAESPGLDRGSTFTLTIPGVTSSPGETAAAS